MRIAVFAILALVFCLPLQSQDFSRVIDTRAKTTAMAAKPKLRPGALLELVGYATAADGYHQVVEWQPASSATIDNVFVFAPAAGQPGRLVATQRDLLDLEYAGLSNGDDITTLLTNASGNFAGGVVRIKLPRSLTNLTCSQVTFPTGLKRFEIIAGGPCTITQIDDDNESMWIIPNQHVVIEAGVKFVGNVESGNFTDSEQGLIKIDGSAKSGVGGTIECHADFDGSTSTGLAIVGVTSAANAYQSIKISGDYEDSGVDASSYAVERDVRVDIRDLTNYNATHPGSRRYTDQPNVLQDGFADLQGRPSLSQGNYPRLVNVRTYLGHDWFEDQVGSSGNQNATIELPAGSIVQLDSEVRLPTGTTITTDPTNPGTIRHPGDTQPCLLIQGADITIENVIIDFAMGESWKTFRTGISLSGGSFFTGDGANWNLNYDGLSGSFQQHETLTFTGGETGILADFGGVFNYDGEASGPFQIGDRLTFSNQSTAVVTSLLDSGVSGSITIAFLQGTITDNNTFVGSRSGATAVVNGTLTTRSMVVIPLTGSTPADNDTITGGTSAATAAVDGTPTVIGSTPDKAIENIDINNVTWINSDDTRRNISARSDRIFAYDGGSGGPFVEGETLTFSGGAVATLFQLTDNGATGSMVAILTSGTIANDNTITGGTSGATAAVNGTVTSQSHSGDGWCFSFAHNSGSTYGVPARNIKVRNCTAKARRFQLTANGSGDFGVENVEIVDNFCDHGFANSIAMSSLSDLGLFKNILIARNTLTNCVSAAIYVGLDTDAGGGAIDVVDMEDVVIRDNRIINSADSAISGADFPTGIIVRCTGNCKRLQIRDNVFNNLKGTGSYSFIDLRGNPAGPDNTFLVKGNQFLGSGNFDINSEYVEYFDDDPLIKDLISFWPLDEASGNALDAFKNNDLTDTNTVTSVADGPNGVNARRFTRSNAERMTAVDKPWNRLQFGDSFTFSTWVRLRSDNSGGVFAKYGLGGSYLLSYSATTDQYSFSIRSAGNTTSVTWTPTIALDEWNHVVCTYYSVTNTMSICLNDGTPVTATGLTVGNPAWTFQFGYNGTSAFADVDLCQFGFWKRALSSQNRAALYNLGSGLPFSSAVFEEPE